MGVSMDDIYEHPNKCKVNKYNSRVSSFLVFFAFLFLASMKDPYI